MSRILIVDDDRNVIDGLKRMLHAQGCPHECEGVTSVAAALERLSGNAYDVIISDVRMPGTDGVEFLARLKGDGEARHIPVIMLTGHADAIAKRTALQLGAYDFLSKPADPAELMARLENAIRLKSYEDQMRKQHEILERQLLQAQRMEVVGLLASGIVHDLNNVLAGIIGHTELAAVRARNNADVQENLKGALESADHATKLVQQILALGRAPSRTSTKSDLSAEIDDSLRLLRAVIPAAVRIEWSKPDASVMVSIEPTQLHQVLMNLCTNAVHAMDGHGCLTVALSTAELTLEQSAEIQAPRPGPYATVLVRDTGAGMDSETLEKIFDPFFTTKPVGTGTGIGLSVVRRILDHHGGAIEVSSAPGEGTTFSIYLPLCDVHRVADISNGGACHVGKKEHPVCR